MSQSAASTKRQVLIAALLAGIAVSPVIGAEQGTASPDFSGLWGRDSLNLESPCRAPVRW